MERVTGLTRRKILHWTKTRLLSCFKDMKARGSQTVSYYSVENVMKALIIYEMTKRGLSLAQVRRVETYLRKKEKLTLTESAKYLVTDGKTAFYREKPTQVVDLLKSKNQMLLIPVWEHWLQVRGALRTERAGEKRRTSG
jgi:DNA-binding transcriptional MerR regulator